MQKKENADCEVYRAMLFDYVSDNLSEQDKAELLMHIELCPECKKELCEAEAIISAASELDEVEVPDKLRAAVSASLAAEAATVRKRTDIRRYALRTLLPVAACAALAVGIYSGGIYDRFVNSDDILSEGTKIQTEESLPEADTDNQATEPDAIEAPIPQINADNPAENKAVSSDNTVKSTKSNDSAPIQSEPEPKSNTESNTKAESIQTPAVPEASEEKAESTERAAEAPASEAAPSPESASRPSGGGSSAASNASGGGSAASRASGGYSMPKDADAQESAVTTDNADIATASAEECEEHDDRGEHGRDENKNKNSAAAAASCTIVTDNPAEFAEGFGISGKSGRTITFRISQERWREFVNYCRDMGVQLDADFSGDNPDYIDVTVKSAR